MGHQWDDLFQPMYISKQADLLLSQPFIDHVLNGPTHSVGRVVNPPVSEITDVMLSNNYAKTNLEWRRSH